MLVSAIADVAEGRQELVRLDIKEKYQYQDSVKTDVIECVSMECACKGIGTVQVCLPYVKGLKERIDERIPYGEKFALDSCGSFKDVSISTYNGKLIVKFLLDSVTF